MLLFTAAILAIVFASVLTASLLTWRGWVAFALATILLGQAMIVASFGFAGLVLRSLQPATLCGLALAWLLFALVVAGWTRRRMGHARRWQRRIDKAAALFRSTVTFPPVAIAGLLLVGAFIWRIFVAVRLPIIDYDGWSYHLVFVDVWLQHDALVPVLQRPWTSGYPAVGEMLMAWLAGFTRTDALTGMVSVAMIPFAVVATIGLARALGANRRWATFAGLLLGMTPTIMALAGTSYVDTTSTFAVLATWGLGVRVLHGERDRSAALLLGIACGIAIGTKGTNLVLVTPIVLVAAFLFAQDALHGVLASGRRLSILGPLVAFGLPLVLIGGSWYVKNVLVFANPVYPISAGPFVGPATVESMTWAPPSLAGLGRFEQVARSWLADWGMQRYAYSAQPGGFGRAWLGIIPLALVGLVSLSRRRNVVALSVILLPIVLTLTFSLNPWHARYMLMVPALGLTFASVALTRMRPHLALAAGLVVVFLAAISLTYVNIRPNIDVRPAVANRNSIKQYLALLLDDDTTRRSNIGLRARCAGFGLIPPGDRVAPGGFNLLHAVVGPDLDRILTAPLGRISSPSEIAAAMRQVDATWLVTNAGGELDAMAAMTPDLVAHGEICQGGRLWSLTPNAAPE